MAPVNQPADLLSQVQDLRRQLDELRRTVGLSSATINRGGLSLLNNAFLRSVDSNGIERFFLGSTSSFEGVDQPVLFIRDAAGKLRIAMYDPQPATDGYQPVFWVFDHADHVAFTTDKNGGVAEPHISVPMMQKFRDGTLGLDAPDSDPTLPISALGASVTCWEGRISKVSHPRLILAGAFGRVTGVSGAPTYSLQLNDVQIGTWNDTTYVIAEKGPFDIASYLGQANVTVKLKVSGTGTGTDRVAVAVYGCWLRQT